MLVWGYHVSLADPGFTRGGCANSQIGIILSIFCQKLYENERMWTPGACVHGTPLRSTNVFDTLSLAKADAKVKTIWPSH